MSQVKLPSHIPRLLGSWALGFRASGLGFRSPFVGVLGLRA